MEKSKKDKRHESKLKKAKAFLQLVRPFNIEHDDAMRVEPETEPEPSGEGDAETQTGSGTMELDLEETTEEGNEDQDSDVKKTKTETEMLPEDCFRQMKMIIREKNKQAMQKPKIFLTMENLAPYRNSNSEPLKDETLPPLYVVDLQHLLLYALQGNIASFKPRWCKLLRVMKVSSVVLLCLDGLGYEELLNDKDSFSWISQSFNTHVEMVCPEQYKTSVDAELCSVPLSVSQLKKVNQKVSFQVKRQVAVKLKRQASESMSRLCLLLSSHQMKMEGYPMPILTKKGQYKDFVFSKGNYTEVTSNSPLYALDCEMCLTTIGKNELTRVSILSESGEIVYDSLVKPRNRIINYLTKYSGITKEMMNPVVTVLEDVQRDIKELLPSDVILCGQSLNSDLMALKMFHPYVIDTSVIYNMSGNRSIKAGLRKLSSFFLGRNIQNSPAGHCSAEDAKATLDLVKLKLDKGLEFGDATISGVYFPNIETYFLGEESGKKGVTENIEEENADDVVEKYSNCQPKLASDYLADNSKEKSHQAIKRAHGGSHTTSSGSDSEDSSSTSEGRCKKRRLSQGDSSVISDSCNDNVNSLLPADPPQTSETNDSAICESQSSSNIAWAGTQQQTEIFSQKNSVHVSHSFFKLVNDAGRTSCFVGHPSLTSKYVGDAAEMITTSNDSEARKCAKSMVQSKEFVWANFSEYREALTTGQLSDAARQKLRRKLDHRIRSVLKKVKENALAVLLLTGRQQGDEINNAGVFVKIT